MGRGKEFLSPALRGGLQTQGRPCHFQAVLAHLSETGNSRAATETDSLGIMGLYVKCLGNELAGEVRFFIKCIFTCKKKESLQPAPTFLGPMCLKVLTPESR